LGPSAKHRAAAPTIDNHFDGAWVHSLSQFSIHFPDFSKFFSPSSAERFENQENLFSFNGSV
jgi:hypothetical protein